MIEKPKIRKEEPQLERVHGFFEMTKDEEKKLESRIEEFDGLVRVFVHPDYELYSEIDHIKEGRNYDPEELKEAEKVFQRILSSDSDKKPPIFVFEAGKNSDDFKKQEERFNKLTKSDLYIIRTELSNPNPLPPDWQEKYDYKHNLSSDSPSKEEREQMWDWLISEFEGLGIKKVLIGGLEFYAKPELDRHGGCLGRVMAEMKDDFELELSTLIWPSSRDEAK